MVVGSLAVGVVLLLVWHACYAWRHCGGRRAFWLGYVAPRLACFACYALYFAVLVPETEQSSSDGAWHLHHWWCAWILSLLLSFNHPVSAAPLAISLAVFTQGLSAYNQADLMSDARCAHYYDTNLSVPEELRCVSAGASDFSVCVRHGNVVCF